MLRHLPAASALAVLLAHPVLAQEASSSSELGRSGLTAPTIMSEGYTTSGTDVLVTKLLGQTVYSSVANDAEEIGKISNLVVTSGLGISAVVISVGGVLGIGQKDVAVDFTQLEWATREDGSRRWVLPTTVEALSEAPAFIWGESEQTTGTPALTPQQEQDQLVKGDPNAAPVDPNLTTDQPERTHITTPADRSGLSEFDKSSLTADQLRGIGVFGIDDEQIGTIGDIVTNVDGSFDAVIVDVGGFLGIGGKPVAVGFDNLVFSVDTAGTRYLFLNATREQLEAQPPYDPATYADNRDTQRMVINP